MFENPDCRDQTIRSQVILQLEKIFCKPECLQEVKELAIKIKAKIEAISPFIEQTTRAVCPFCKDVCCISKHGYYSFEDLVYIHAIGLKPHLSDFGRKDADPCQFLSGDGCSLERQFRPSGCNWYFCEALFDHMEQRPEYRAFDDSLREIAELWMKMMEEFKNAKSQSNIR